MILSLVLCGHQTGCVVTKGGTIKTSAAPFISYESNDGAETVVLKTVGNAGLLGLYMATGLLSVLAHIASCGK